MIIIIYIYIDIYKLNIELSLNNFFFFFLTTFLKLYQLINNTNQNLSYYIDSESRKD